MVIDHRNNDRENLLCPFHDYIAPFHRHDRSGQVRSECLTASCCNRHRTKKGGGSKGGLPALAGTREYEQSDQNQ